MRLFKSRATALLEQHLERLDVDPVWWPHVKAAISCCEQKQWFDVVPTAAGPVPARNVVALLKLDSFVCGGVDWDAHPNPFLNDPATRAYFYERLQKSTSRWEELYDSNPAPPDGDLADALQFMCHVTGNASATGALTDDALATVHTIGWAGYCWRLAEEQAHAPAGQQYEAALRSVWDAFPEDPPRESVTRDRLLFWGATQVAHSVQPHMKPAGRVEFKIWQGCPGGYRPLDFEYFDAGFDHARDQLVRDETVIATADLWFAWCFGVGLRDFERFLDHV